jgi:hypothetical protein
MQQRCPHLAGQCIETGDHWDHLGPFHILDGTYSIEHTVRVRLEHWEGAELTIGIYTGDQAFDLTVRQTMEFVAMLVRCALQPGIPLGEG